MIVTAALPPKRAGRLPKNAPFARETDRPQGLFVSAAYAKTKSVWEPEKYAELPRVCANVHDERRGVIELDGVSLNGGGH